MLQALEHDLAEAVVIDHIRHLSVDELGHEGAGLKGVADDGPPPHAVFHHQVFGQRRRDFLHVAPVCFFADACFAVGEDGEAEVFARGQAWVSSHVILGAGEGETTSTISRESGSGDSWEYTIHNTITHYTTPNPQGAPCNARKYR